MAPFPPNFPRRLFLRLPAQPVPLKKTVPPPPPIGNSMRDMERTQMILHKIITMAQLAAQHGKARISVFPENVYILMAPMMLSPYQTQCQASRLFHFGLDQSQLLNNLSTLMVRPIFPLLPARFR